MRTRIAALQKSKHFGRRLLDFVVDVFVYQRDVGLPAVGADGGDHVPPQEQVASAALAARELHELAHLFSFFGLSSSIHSTARS